MSDQPFKAGIGTVSGEHQAHQRLARAIEDAFGVPAQTRRGVGLDGDNDVIQLLLNSDFWQWIALVSAPFASSFKDKLVEKFGDAAAEEIWKRILARFKKGKKEIDRPDAERKLAAIVFALESVDDPQYIINVGLASPGAEGGDRNIVFRLTEPTLRSFSSIAVPLAVLAPAVEAEIAAALSDGFSFSGQSNTRDVPEPQVILIFTRQEPAYAELRITITIGGNGEPSIVRN